jgi:FtsP/CotA-like multicopper oxidase with cupredoxin domain
MNMITRRQFLASSAACGFASAVSPLIASDGARAAAPALLRAESRVIEVGGRAAKVLGLLREDGKQGLALRAGEAFRVRLQNALDAPTLIHWHGLTPPFGQDGVPDLPQPLLKPGDSYDYAFPLETAGTHWMHAHTLQEQQLLAAPLIVSDPAEDGLDEQEAVVLLHDFSFKEPEEILAGLTGSSMSGHGGSHGGHGQAAGGHGSAGAAMDVNDIEYDAYLANDRTLDDPEVFRVERSGSVRLRLINGATATAFWVDIGALQGEVIAVDGNPVVPVPGRRFPLGMGQRIDIRLRVPSEEGAWPVFALREGAVQRTGFILSTAAGLVKRAAAAGEQAAPPLDLAFEQQLRAAPALPESRTARTHPAVLGGTMEGYAWTINGRTWNDRLPLRVRAGDRVELAMRNDSMMGHPMHLHGHHFQVVEINGRRFEGARRDTVWLPPESAVTVAFDASNHGTWAFHCHHLYHMAAGMMTVVEYVG